MSKKGKRLLWGISALVAVAAAVAGIFLLWRRPNPCSLLRQQGSGVAAGSENKALEGCLSRVIGGDAAGGTVTDVGVYFRDLKNGTWAGVNQSEKFAPGSLLKIPIMLIYYAAAETHPEILTKQVTYLGTTDLNALQVPRPAHSLVYGKTYTVDELIRGMIVNSGNNSYDILANQISSSSLGDFYASFGIPLPADGDPNGEFVSPEAYANILGKLYDHSYLDASSSEKAIALLEDATFSNGLRAPVPTSIPIAHKYGERGVVTTDGSDGEDFGDCGIVYYPGENYILCVMTHGTDFPTLSKVIAHLSQLTYTYVSSGR